MGFGSGVCGLTNGGAVAPSFARGLAGCARRGLRLIGRNDSPRKTAILKNFVENFVDFFKLGVAFGK